MTFRDSGSLEGVVGESAGGEASTSGGGEILQRHLRGALLRIVGAAATCAVSIGVSVALIDRPVAT
jgi:hypothetical protein